jgi:hypothetical protein
MKQKNFFYMSGSAKEIVKSSNQKFENIYEYKECVRDLKYIGSGDRDFENGKSKLTYKYLATSDATEETNLYLLNGTHELPKSFIPTEALINDAVVGFSISPIEDGVTNFLSDITIEVLPDYEGAYCLDGVNDYIKIDTNGGMTMLMKANVMSTFDRILYDQRNSEEGGNFSGRFAIMTSNSDSLLAYAGRNPTGKTYIDGILNANITCAFHDARTAFCKTIFLAPLSLHRQ